MSVHILFVAYLYKKNFIARALFILCYHLTVDNIPRRFVIVSVSLSRPCSRVKLYGKLNGMLSW